MCLVVVTTNSFVWAENLAENFSWSGKIEVEAKRARLPATGPFAFSEEALYLFRTKSPAVNGQDITIFESES